MSLTLDSGTHPETDPRIAAQVAFLAEADRLKSVERACVIHDLSRRENSAEHSWHVALWALIFADQAGEGVDAMRALRMLLIHDLVEIDAGDMPLYAPRPADHDAAEQAAAERIFGLLPEDQGAEMLALWREFEDGGSPDARFARSLDRMQPVVQNLITEGGTWNEYAVTPAMIDARVAPPASRGAPRLWAWLRKRIGAHFAE